MHPSYAWGYIKEEPSFMKDTKKVYTICPNCNNCPTAEDTAVGGEVGLLIRDDFGGKVTLTSNQLKDLATFLKSWFK